MVVDVIEKNPLIWLSRKYSAQQCCRHCPALPAYIAMEADLPYCVGRLLTIQEGFVFNPSCCLAILFTREARWGGSLVAYDPTMWQVVNQRFVVVYI